MSLYHGDCLDVMAGLEPESVDAVVTDPPYDLTSTGARNGSPRNPGTGPYSRGFMGRAWDGTGIAFRPETWEAAYRVAKPSAYLLAFGGTRTVHRLTTAIEDAGWVIRDMLVWAYASGFPKSKASLKPAWEPIVMARKPGPLRMLAIDECRIGWGADTPTQEEWNRADSSGQPGANGYAGQFSKGMKDAYAEGKIPVPSGRWPANVILTDPIFDGGWDGVVGGGEARSSGEYPVHEGWTGQGYGGSFSQGQLYGDSGTYSRFFLIPKADRTDREPVLRPISASAVASATSQPELVSRLGSEPTRLRRAEVVEGPESRHPASAGNGNGEVSTVGPAQRANVHPTVKPVDLMRHLVRLVTPTGGTVLDPFLGSGTTAIAAEMEGFDWIGIEKEAEYVAIAEARLNGTQRGLGLPA